MAVCFNVTNKSYFKTLNHSNLSYRLMVEILDHFENTIDRIEQDIDSNDIGSIQCNNQQGTRKSCSFTLINVDEKYTIEENHPFWYNRKFRLWLGVTDNTDTFYFAKGVYITLSADSDSAAKTVSINGVDKYGQLDGTLKVLASDIYDTTFEIGSKIDTVVRDILMLDLGNGYVLDPVEPIIDYDIGMNKLYKEYTLGAGEYYGSFMTELMTSFGCDIFYNNMGRLVIQRVFNEDLPYWFVFKSPEYEFSHIKPHYSDPKLNGELTGINKVTVSIEEDNTEATASYTAYNKNPRSPLCYDRIGARVYEQNGGIIYISAGDDSADTPAVKCKDYAEYILLQETCRSLSMSFSAQVIPHLNEGDIITIKDPQFNLDNEKFIINSISFPLGIGEMNIEATNISYLPTSLDNSALNMEVNNPYIIKYTLNYDLGDAIGSLPSYTSAKSGSMLKLSGSLSDDGKHTRFYKDNAEFIGWYCNADGNTYMPYAYYSMPNQDVTMSAQYESTEGTELRIKTLPLSNSLAFTLYNIYPNSNISTLTVNENKRYFSGLGLMSQTNFVVTSSEQSDTLDIALQTTQSNKENLDVYIMNSMVNNMSQYCDELYYPDFIESMDLHNSLNGFPFSKIEFPLSCSSYNFKNALTYCNNLEAIEFPYIGETVLNLDSGSGIYSLNKLKSFTANGDMTINNGAMLQNVPALESVYIKNDLTLTSSNILSSINAIADLYVGGNLNMSNSYFCVYKTTCENFTFKIQGDLTLTNGSGLLTGCNPLIVTIGGTALLESNSQLLNGATLGEITFNDECIINNSAMLNGATIGNVVFNANCNLNGGTLLGGSTINNLIFNGNVSATGSTIICSVESLTKIEFHGSVNISTDSFCCQNSALTDIYFYEDNVSISGNGFVGNNENLTIHGIADGNVQAIAENYGLNFEPLEMNNNE